MSYEPTVSGFEEFERRGAVIMTSNTHDLHIYRTIEQIPDYYLEPSGDYPARPRVWMLRTPTNARTHVMVSPAIYSTIHTYFFPVLPLRQSFSYSVSNREYRSAPRKIHANHFLIRASIHTTTYACKSLSTPGNFGPVMQRRSERRYSRHGVRITLSQIIPTDIFLLNSERNRRTSISLHRQSRSPMSQSDDQRRLLL